MTGGRRRRQPGRRWRHSSEPAATRRPGRRWGPPGCPPAPSLPTGEGGSQAGARSREEDAAAGGQAGTQGGCGAAAVAPRAGTTKAASTPGQARFISLSGVSVSTKLAQSRGVTETGGGDCARAHCAALAAITNSMHICTGLIALKRRALWLLCRLRPGPPWGRTRTCSRDSIAVHID